MRCFFPVVFRKVHSFGKKHQKPHSYTSSNALNLKSNLPVCSRSHVHFNVATSYIKMAKNSWTAHYF